ncbi:PhoH-like ATPase [Ferrimonas sediminum]|uniref:PhoH-like ATPase n=1 Tax=Ferrimonas sediminum TaxID=718193 RepID=A0A1G8UYU5_9GAMM|nr:PhoH family protein [Ferrimonas sediminum]SDJ58899.1 PhoH-like ATPase [Ferrimonas sediminum]
MVRDKKKRFVLDTNVLLHEPLAIYSFQEHDVVIPMTVLEELDQIKDRRKDISRDARVAIRTLEDCLVDASPEEILQGVLLNHPNAPDDELGTLSIFPDHQIQFANPVALPGDNNDNLIINSALYLQQQSDDEIVLVTKDINMRLKAKGAGLKKVEDYRTDQLVDDIQFLAKGFAELEGNLWDYIKEVSSEQRGREVYHTLARNELPEESLYINQYLIDDSKLFCGQVKEVNDQQVLLRDLGQERLMGYHAWGINPKNVYQGMAMQALLDPNIDMVILTGPAGSGKTLLSLAAALEQVVEQRRYDKVIVTRNTPEIAESIGFLPGTEEEKMTPWLAAVTDTLEVLHKQDESPAGSLQYIMDKANIQFKSMNFMRGRSIQNAFVLLDECQNLTPSQLKTIITRMGEGTKLVCSGNLAQIDSNYLTAVTSGLTYVVERFKNFEGSANVYLNGVVRSRLAKFAENEL